MSCVFVVLVALVGVGFALEADVAVAFHEAAALYGAKKPLGVIPDDEADEEELALLEGVDVFMVLYGRIHASLPATAEDDAKDVGGKEGTKREVFVVDYFHCNPLYSPAKVRFFCQLVCAYNDFL